MNSSRRRWLQLGLGSGLAAVVGCASEVGLATPSWLAGSNGAASNGAGAGGGAEGGGTGSRWSLPGSCTQLVVGLAPDWAATSLVLRRFERAPGGAWQPVGGAVPTRLGPGGLAWGRGLHPTPTGVTPKREGDGKTPVGVFSLGPVYGYAPTVARQPGMAYTQIQEGDLWISDTRDPRYNQFVRLGRPPQTEWELRERMRQNDYPHSLKMLIGHNTGARRVAGAGSAIFFHIWRQDGGRATAGCTAMPEPALRELIAWVNPARNPLYVLLPQSEYQRLRGPWGLP